MRHEGGEHLSSEEISRLLDAGEGRSSAVSCGRMQNSAPDHVSSCASCAALLSLQQKITEELGQLEVKMIMRPSAECPKESKWLDLAAGLIGSSESRLLSQHAADCDYCGPQLRAAVEDFSPKFSPEEQTLLEQLPSSTLSARKQLAARMAQASEKPHPTKTSNVSLERAPWFSFLFPVSRGRRWAAVAASVLAVGTAVWFALERSGPSVEQLLAEAYAENRQMDLRLPGSRYSSLATTRGEDDFSHRRKAEPYLNKAEEEIRKGIEREPNNQRWKQADATLDILRGDPGDSINALNSLLKSQPNSAQIMNDLAIAYYSRSQHPGSDPDDIHTAYEWIARAYQASLKNPDPVIVYNYAIILETLNQPQNALAMWSKYLELDNSSGWAAEARKHKQALEEMLKNHKLGEFRPTSPVEPFLDQAINSWLPAAFPVAGIPDRYARERLEEMSGNLVSQHRDVWLRQVVDSAGNSSFPLAVHELAAASVDNGAGRHQAARQHAMNAANLFLAMGNQAGWARSETERVYALQRLAEGELCLRAANSLADRLTALRFPWIEVQNLLEIHSCSQMLRLRPPDRAELEQITSRAKDFGYTSLALRAQGFLADEMAAEDVPDECIRASMQGLETYWKTPYEKPARAFILYQALAELAENSGSWELAYDFNRESALTLSTTSYALLQSLAWTHTAQAATALGRDDDARGALATSEQLLKQVPEQQTVALYAADNALWSAQLSLRHNHIENARRELDLVATLISPAQAGGDITVSNYSITLPYYAMRGQVALAQQDWPTAEAALQSAQRLAEANQASFDTYHERLMWTREVASLYRELVAFDLDFRHDPQQALLDWERYRALPDQGGRVPHNTGDIIPGTVVRRTSAASSEFPEFFLTFVATPARTAVLMLDQDGVVHGGWCAGSADQLRQTELDFRRDIRRSDSSLSAVRSEAQALGNELLGPVREWLPERALLIIQPDEGVGEIPFPALIDHHGNYLLQHFTIVIAPHTPRSWALPEGAAPDAPALAVRVEHPPGRQSLGNLKPEVEAVRAAYPNLTELANDDAGARRIVAELGKAAVFHFAGHSYELPQSTALLLANGDKAGPESIAKADLSRLRLVALSACDTARSRFASRDDESLMGVFLARGIPYVIATGWPVNSEATVSYVQALYRHMGTGVSVPEAVRLAGLDMLKGKDTALPFYWAGFETFIGFSN